MLNRFGSYLLMLLLLSHWSTAAVMSAGHAHGPHGEVSLTLAELAHDAAHAPANLPAEVPSPSEAPAGSTHHDCVICAVGQATPFVDASPTMSPHADYYVGWRVAQDRVVVLAFTSRILSRGPPASHPA